MISTYVITIDGWCAGSDVIPITEAYPYADWLAYPPDGSGTEITRPNPSLWWIGVGAVNTSLYVDPALDPSGRSLSRLGGWVRVYEDGVPRGQWMILADGPESDVGYGEGFILAPLEDGDTIDTAAALTVRLEDPYKLVTTIPDWIPAESEAYERWIPVVSDFTSTFGQTLELKGGVASIDGSSFSIVMDQEEPALQRLVRIIPDAWEYIDTVVNIRSNNTLYRSVDDDDTELVIQYSLDGEVQNGDLQSYSHPPSFAELLADETFPFISSTSPVPRVVEPTFFGTEAVWLDSSDPGTSDEYFWVYDVVERHCARTARIPQRRLSLAFSGLPSPIGSVVRTYLHLWGDNRYQALGFEPKYTGLLSGINYSQGVSTAEFTLDPLLFTASVAGSMVVRTPSEVKRVTVPKNLKVGKKLKFRNRFIVRQRNPNDRFRWVLINGIVFPFNKQRNANYATITNANDRTRFETVYGIKPGRGTVASEIYRDYIEVEEATGLIDAFYYIGTSEIAIDSVFRTSNRTETGLPQFNCFATSDPEFYRFSAYRVENISDFKTWASYETVLTREAFTEMFQINVSAYDLTDDDIKTAVLQWSESDHEICHLFEPWCVGISTPDESPEGYKWAWYDSRLRVGGGVSQRGAFITVSPVDVILQVLTSTGTGHYDLGVNTPGFNGPFDMLPSEFGYGIPIDQIRMETFERVWRNIGSASMMRNAWINLDSDPIEWLTEQILEPFLLCIATDSTGKIVLVDLADFKETIDSYTIELAEIVKQSPSAPIEVTDKTEYTDVADGFSYKWYEPWTDFASFYSQNTYIVQGQAARTQDGQIATANIFSRIQRDPVSADLEWGIPNAAAFGQRIQTYLSAYRRTTSRVTFPIRIDPEVYIGRSVVFQMPYVAGETGDYSGELRLFVAKVVDSKVDVRRGIQELECLIYSESTPDNQEILWNLTGLISDVSGDTVTIEDNYYIATPSRDAFIYDWSVFAVGDEVTIWDVNWVRVVDSEIVAIDRVGGVTTFELTDATGATTDCRITLRRRDGTTTPFVSFLAWHRDQQRLG